MTEMSNSVFPFPADSTDARRRAGREAASPEMRKLTFPSRFKFASIEIFMPRLKNRRSSTALLVTDTAFLQFKLKVIARNVRHMHILLQIMRDRFLFRISQNALR